MNNTNYSDIGLFAAIIATIGVIITLFFNINKKLDKNTFILNTYMYILLAILLCVILIIIMDKYEFFHHINTISLLIVFVIAIIIIFALYYIGKEHYILRHILWLIFLVCISFILFPSYELAKNSDVLWKSLVTVIILVGIITYIASRYPRNYFNSWGIYLGMGLVALIIFELLDLLFGGNSPSRLKIYGIIGVILFSGFILYDTDKIYQNADQTIQECQGINNQLQCADYPGVSLNFFLDIVNLFTSGTMVYQ